MSPQGSAGGGAIMTGEAFGEMMAAIQSYAFRCASCGKMSCGACSGDAASERRSSEKLCPFCSSPVDPFRYPETPEQVAEELPLDVLEARVVENVRRRNEAMAKAVASGANPFAAAPRTAEDDEFLKAHLVAAVATIPGRLSGADVPLEELRSMLKKISLASVGGVVHATQRWELVTLVRNRMMERDPTQDDLKRMMADVMMAAHQNVIKASEEAQLLLQMQNRMATAPANPTASGREAQSSGCFIATACYTHDDDAWQVVLLKSYRDEVLDRTSMGRVLTRVYYRISPPVAVFLRRHSFARACVRNVVLNPMVLLLVRAGVVGGAPANMGDRVYRKRG